MDYWRSRKSYERSLLSETANTKHLDAATEQLTHRQHRVASPENGAT
jgi:hypothetical protein